MVTFWTYAGESGTTLITVISFLMKKCIHLANSTFNLYVLYIKLAQNTKQFRRLVLENFITAISFLFGRKGILLA